MRFTKVHVNALICCLMLLALQIFVLVLINGGLREVILQGTDQLDVLILIFSPSAAIAWIGKHFAGLKDD